MTGPPTNGTEDGTVAVLLAAGAGTRLARGPKALLLHRGRPLVAHVADVLLAGGCDVVVVVAGAGADRVRRVATGGARVRVVVADDWRSGMGASLRVGLAAALALGPSRVLVAHVDQPGLVPDDVARLLEHHRPGRVAASRWTGAVEQIPAGASGTAGRPGWGHPLVLDAVLAGPAAASAHGDRGARDFLREHADLIDVVDHPGDGRDLDTEADLDLLAPPPDP